MNKETLLIVEDDVRLRASLSIEFEDKGYEVVSVGTIEEIPSQNFVFGIVDLRLNGRNGLSVIEHIKVISPDCRIIILTGYGSISTAVEAIKLGAVNYLTKPADIDKIERALRGEPFEESRDEQPLSLSRQEHEYIEYMLSQNEGNITKTAKALGLHRQSLQRKLKKRP